MSFEAWELLRIEPRPCAWVNILYFPVDALVTHRERRSFFTRHFATLLSYGYFCGCHRLKQSNKLKACRANCPLSIGLYIQRGLLISDPVAIKPCLAEILTLTQRVRGGGFTHICIWCVLLSSLWEKGEQFLSWRENVDTASPDPRGIFE